MKQQQTPFEELKAKHGAMEGFKAALANYLSGHRTHGNRGDYAPIDRQLELLELIPAGSKTDGTVGSGVSKEVQRHSAYRSEHGREVGVTVAKAAWATLEQLLEIRDKKEPAAIEYLKTIEQIVIHSNFSDDHADAYNQATEKANTAYGAVHDLYVKMMQLEYLLARYAPEVRALFKANLKTNHKGMPSTKAFQEALEATRRDFS